MSTETQISSISSRITPKPTSLIPFKHQPLHPRGFNVFQIRLLILEPGANADKVRCRLENVDLDERVVYEALSYVWGDPNDTVTIVVENQALEVTRNLFLALSHLRFPNEPRTLWVDAICIDQSNTAEKGRQVQFMSEIYRKASQVIAWLGARDHDSDRALEIVRHLHASVEPVIRALEAEDLDPMQLRRVIRSMTQERLSSLTAATVEEWQNLSFIDQEALRSTFRNREYWHRVWILQEVILARNLTMRCGVDNIPWSYVERLLMLMSHAHQELTDDIRPLRTLNSARGRGDQGLSVSLAQALLAGCRCSDQRDYVYAMLGLSVLGTSITSDYTKTVSEVFHEATREVIRRERDLAFVFQPRCLHSSAPEFSRQSYGTGSNGRLTDFKPSWTMDWSARFTNRKFEYLCAEGGPVRRKLSVDVALASSHPRILSLKGVRHNTLTYVNPGPHSQETRNHHREQITKQIMLSVHKHMDTIKIEKVIQALFQGNFRSRIGGELHPIPIGGMELRIIKFLYREWLGLDGMTPNEREGALDLQAQHDELSGRSLQQILSFKYLYGYTFFLSDIGDMGLAFGKPQLGDELWSVHGTLAPVILRPKQDASVQSQLGVYEFVGSAWMSGMMRGEVWDAIDAYQESLTSDDTSEEGFERGSDHGQRNQSEKETKNFKDCEQCVHKLLSTLEY